MKKSNTKPEEIILPRIPYEFPRFTKIFPWIEFLALLIFTIGIKFISISKYFYILVLIEIYYILYFSIGIYGKYSMLIRKNIKEGYMNLCKKYNIDTQNDILPLTAELNMKIMRKIQQKKILKENKFLMAIKAFIFSWYPNYLENYLKEIKLAYNNKNQSNININKIKRKNTA